MPIPHSDADKATKLSQQELGDLPASLTWLVLLQNGLAPYVLYVLLTANSSSSNAYLVVAWIGLWLCAAVASGLALLRFRFRIAAALALATSVSASLVWVGYADNAYVVWMFPALVAGTLYRIRRFLGDSFLNDENRLAFHIDCILVVMGLLGCAAIAGTAGPVFAFACSNGLAAILLRIYTMWRVERISHDSQGAPRGTWGWMAACFILLAMFGPVLWQFMADGLRLLGSLMAPFDSSQSGSWQLQTDNQSPANRLETADNMLYTTAHLRRQASPEWFGLALLLALGVVAIVLIIRWFRQRETKPTKVQGAVSTSRRWLGRPETLRLLPTDNAVRQEFQKLIREQYARGNKMQPHETAKAFLERIYGMAALKEAPHVQADLPARYNQARYRSETPDQS